jgi:ribosomal protein L28
MIQTYTLRSGGQNVEIKVSAGALQALRKLLLASSSF